MNKRERADAAYLRTLTEPVPEGALVGQVDALTGAVAGAPMIDTIVDGIPEVCSSCLRRQTLKQGWTLVAEGRIQCGACGYLVLVADAAWQSLRVQLREKFARSDAPPKPERRGKKTRGAG